MGHLLYVLSFPVRVLRGERFRKATPEELKLDGASFGLAGLLVLLLLAIDPDVWTAPPIFLWTGVVLALFPLAVFSLWIGEGVPPLRSMAVGPSIPAVVLTFGFLHPQGSVLVVKAAQGGLVLYIALMALGSKIRKAG